MPDELVLFDEPRRPRLPGFSCVRSKVGEMWRVTVGGELDIATVPELDRSLRGAEIEAGAVVLDLRALELMDANAAQLLVDADRRIARAGGRLIVVRGSAMVDWFLALIGVDRLLELVDRPPAQEEPAL